MRAGEKLGPYELLSPLGAGGMGEVWKARDPRLDRIVAIKFSQDQFTARFEREAQAIAALNHPNVCQIYDVGPNYLVMEFVDGEPIAAPGDVTRLLDFAMQIADGLAAAHAAGIVHRDLKPANILLSREGRVKILDFGLAKQTAATASAEATRTVTSTSPGTVLGTVAYMSPEQARARELDSRSDQFSFGLILYELAAGKRAFDRESSAELMVAIIREQPAPLPATIPAPLRWTIERCLAKEPAERYDSTRDLYRELRQIREHVTETFAPSTAVAPAATRRRSSFAVPALSLALIGVVATALLVPVPAPELATLTPFATEFEIQTMPAWSPKGDRIAYVAAVNSVFQVFTRTLESAAPTQMTHHAASCSSPQWSADGLRLYYVLTPNTSPSLWSVAVAGGEPEKVLDNVYQAAFSPDGKTIAVTTMDSAGQMRLAFSEPPGAPPRLYTQPPFDHAFAVTDRTALRFSRDGKSLGMVITPHGEMALWRVPRDGSKPQSLRGYSHQFFRGFDWLAGDRDVIFAGLQASDVRSGRSRRLMSAGDEAFPALSPDGKTLAFASGLDSFDVVEVTLDGSPFRSPVTNARSSVSPAWSSDGEHFAYITARSGDDEVWIRNRRDGSERLLVKAAAFPGAASSLLDCAFSPDGSRVAYRVEYGLGASQIWISLLTGEAPVRMWEDSAGAKQRGPSWSPDGNWIAYYSTRENKPAVLRYRVGSKRAPDLVTFTTEPRPVRYSPRGDWIAFTDGTNLRLVSPDGARNLVVSHTLWETHGWSKDGAALYGIAIDLRRHLYLGRIAIDTLKETTIADLGPASASLEYSYLIETFAFRGFSLSPDGKSFLTSQFRSTAQILLMRNFDRTSRLLDLFH